MYGVQQLWVYGSTRYRNMDVKEKKETRKRMVWRNKTN